MESEALANLGMGKGQEVSESLSQAADLIDEAREEIKAEEEKVNKYDIGDCFKVNPSSDFQIYKITRVDIEKKDYYYRLCVKYKGCQTEEQQELISNFEYDHRPKSQTKCFR